MDWRVSSSPGIEPSVGSKGDSYDNALAESVIGLFKTEVIRRLRFTVPRLPLREQTPRVTHCLHGGLGLDRPFGSAHVPAYHSYPWSLQYPPVRYGRNTTRVRYFTLL